MTFGAKLTRRTFSAGVPWKVDRHHGADATVTPKKRVSRNVKTVSERRLHSVMNLKAFASGLICACFVQYTVRAKVMFALCNFSLGFPAAEKRHDSETDLQFERFSLPSP